MAVAMRLIVATRLSLRGPRIAFWMKFGPPWPTVSTSRLLASEIWVFSSVRLRSTSALAEAGIAGRLGATAGQFTVPGDAAFVVAFCVPLLDVSPAKALPAITAPDSTTAAAPPIITTRRLLYFGRALDMRKPHLVRSGCTGSGCTGSGCTNAAPAFGGSTGKRFPAFNHR